jgi:hypothetical protein
MEFDADSWRGAHNRFFREKLPHAALLVIEVILLDVPARSAVTSHEQSKTARTTEWLLGFG